MYWGTSSPRVLHSTSKLTDHVSLPRASLSSPDANPPGPTLTPKPRKAGEYVVRKAEMRSEHLGDLVSIERTKSDNEESRYAS